TGAEGPFAVEVPAEQTEILRLVRTSHGVYAAGDVLRRRDPSGTWSTSWPSAIIDVAEAPDRTLVGCGLGVYASTTGDFTDAVELPAPPEAWYSCTISDTGAIVVSGAGEVWSASDLTAARSAVSWKRIATPLDGAQLISVLASGDYWLIGAG